jgi:hypothetical protein
MQHTLVVDRGPPGVLLPSGVEIPGVATGGGSIMRKFTG